MIALSAVCVLLVSATFTVFSAASITDENCAVKLVADIYILTDGSNSINSVAWGRSLAFVSDFTKSFSIGPSNVQFAYGTFSTNFVHIGDLNKYNNQDDLSQAVLNTTQLKGLTYTFDALRAIRVNGYLNSTSTGARPGVPKIVLVITDGNSDDISRTIAEADALRDEQGVRIIVVSVGAVNQVECIGIAGSENNVFSVKNFGGLEAIKSQITHRVCEEPEPEPDRCPETIEVDLVFAIDASGSIGVDNYQKNFEFVVKSIREFTLGPNSALVALLTFGTSPRVIFPLTDDINLIYEKLMDVPYENGTTNTHLALYKALELLSVENGGRHQANKTIVLVTDCLSTEPSTTLEAASTLRNLQTLVITLGVEPEADEAELQAVATKPEFFFPVSNYDDLVSFATPVSVIVCDEPAPPPTEPTPPPTEPTPPPTEPTPPPTEPTPPPTEPTPPPTEPTPPPTEPTPPPTEPTPPPTEPTPPPTEPTPPPTEPTPPPTEPTPPPTEPTPPPTEPTPPPTESTPPPTEPAPPPTVKPCPAATIVDIFFLVDSSGSIGKENYYYNFQFIQGIIDVYYISEDGAKVALLTFGGSVKPMFQLSGDPEFIREQLQNVAYQGSTTNTHLALNYVLDNGWNTAQNGARNGSQVIILITDGQSSFPDETLKAADRVKADGLTIIVVGVGDGVDEDEINAVASKPEYAITVNDYSVLAYIASKTSDIACNNEQE